MNYCASHFKQTHVDVQNLQTKVYKDHNLKLEELTMTVKEIKEENKFMKARVDGIESNLPKMIREMVDYYADLKVTPELQKFLSVE